MHAKTAGAGTALLCAFPVIALLAAAPAMAQNSNSATGEAYSYKRPSPTTITSFKSLYDMCVASTDDALTRSEHSLCVGYFSGLIDYYLAVTPAASRQFCLPTDPPLTRDAARDKLVLWAATNPAAANKPAAVGVYDFLTASFPCAANGG